MTVEELVAALPPKAIVDKHVARYFKSPFPSRRKAQPKLIEVMI